MAFLNCSKRGDCDYYGDWDKGQRRRQSQCHWDSDEEQESRRLVGEGMGKTAASVHYKC